MRHINYLRKWYLNCYLTAYSFYRKGQAAMRLALKNPISQLSSQAKKTKEKTQEHAFLPTSFLQPSIGNRAASLPE
jgi:hypothetical protein